MKETTKARELITLDGLEVIIRGTYHKRREGISDSRSNRINPGRVGVVFLSGLAATRAAQGDAAVYWGDSLGECGYECFRLDLPGFGDSEGDPPEDWFQFIDNGGYASIASAKIKELAARFNLSDFVIMGQCGGAVTAIFTAAISRECKGLILMEPYFHFHKTPGPKLRQRVHEWALDSLLGSCLRNIYHFLREFLLKAVRFFLRRNDPPQNANFRLIHCWKRLTSSGLPVLILQASASAASERKAAAGEFDYLKHVLELAGRESRVTAKVVSGANHPFSNRLGRAAVQQHFQQWLSACFPLTVQPGDSADGRDHSVCYEPD
ncbi:MAG TPA: alpha/beta fold hydrolase [Terracidiphilus sp.]|jgi:pimeloyl-ACP methyl ester carboxylesterase